MVTDESELEGGFKVTLVWDREGLLGERWLLGHERGAIVSNKAGISANRDG